MIIPITPNPMMASTDVGRMGQPPFATIELAAVLQVLGLSSRLPTTNVRMTNPSTVTALVGRMKNQPFPRGRGRANAWKAHVPMTPAATPHQNRESFNMAVTFLSGE